MLGDSVLYIGEEIICIFSCTALKFLWDFSLAQFEKNTLTRNKYILIYFPYFFISILEACKFYAFGSIILGLSINICISFCGIVYFFNWTLQCFKVWLILRPSSYSGRVEIISCDDDSSILYISRWYIYNFIYFVSNVFKSPK